MTLDEISKLLGEITQGDWIDPWEVEPDDDFEGIKSETGEVVLSVQWHDGDRLYLNKPNSKFICAAPTIIRELVKRVRRLERQKVVNSSILRHEDRLVGGRNPFTPGYTKEST